MKRLRLSKKKNWRRAELDELRALVDTKSNAELCEYFKISIETLRNTMQKYSIKRQDTVLEQMKSDAMAGENNPNWKGGISKDMARYLAIQRERYPERKHARDAVYRAVKEGRLIKPDRCEDCGATGRIEGHHHSYEPEHWLDVKWVCKRCHNKRDKQDLTS